MRKYISAFLAALILFAPISPAFGQIARKAAAGAATPTSYDPGGVLFNPEAGARYITAGGNLNGGTDTRHGIIAFRRRGSLGVKTVNGPPDNWRYSAIFGTYGDGTCNAEGCKGFLTNQDWAGAGSNGEGPVLQTTLAGSNDGSPPNPGDRISKTNFYNDWTWESVVIIYDTNAAAGSRVVRFWVDGVLKSPTVTDTGVAFDVNWNVTRGVCINYCNRGSGLPTGGYFELQDVIVDTANALPAGCGVGGVAANCQAVVDAYYKSGKPVSPGTTATNCDTFRASYSASVRTDWCLRGPASGFLANTDGTAQVMSLANGVASSPITPVLYNAPYGQNNEPTDRPFFVWAARSDGTTSTSVASFDLSTGSGSSVMGNYGGSILTGDRLFAFVPLCYTLTAASTTLPTAPAGWAFVGSVTTANPFAETATGARCMWPVYTHVATANYVAANFPWQTGNAFFDPPVFTFTSTGVAPKAITATLVDYRSANGVVNIDASDFQEINRNGGLSSNYATPSITTTKAAATLVSVCMNRNGNAPIIVPTGTNLRKTQPYSSSNIPQVIVADEQLSTAGSTGARTFTQPASASTNDRDFCGLIALANS